MGKTSKWIRSFLTGKKDKESSSSFTTENPTPPIVIPPTTPKEKKRWSFRRSATVGGSTKESNSMDLIGTTPPVVVQAKLDSDIEQKQHAMAVTAATAAAVAASQAAAALIRLTAATTGKLGAIEEAAAIKIQAVFRSYLARKALRALKGLVRLQALVRGYLVRKQATATLRCMQALVTVQTRALAQRIQVAEEAQPISERQTIHRKFPQDNRFRQSYRDMERGVEENIKIVEMDICESRRRLKSRNCYPNHSQIERDEHRLSTNTAGYHSHSKLHHHHQISPAPSALTNTSPRAYSGHFEEHIFSMEQNSPQCYSAVSKTNSTRAPSTFSQPDYVDSMSHNYPFFPNYMTNTESSKAKVRSQSAPKQRPESCERPPSRRRSSMEGRKVPWGVRMQRSSSHVGSTAHGYQNPWSIKLDRSTMSLKDSDCGSTSTVLTNTNYCRSLVSYDVSSNQFQNIMLE